MEDPGEECEYEDFCDSSEEALGKSSLSWLWSKGLWLGKRVVITGVVITSAPLVLPPLVVVSALGFAFSVPAGVVLVSYACTEKLMNKLLPIPTSPLLEDGDDSFEKIDTAEEPGIVFDGTGVDSLKDIEEVERTSYTLGKDINYDEEDKHLVERADPRIENLEEVDKKEQPISDDESRSVVKGVAAVMQGEMKEAEDTNNQNEQGAVPTAAVENTGKVEEAGVNDNKEAKVQERNTVLHKKTHVYGSSNESSKKKNKKKGKSCLKIPHGGGKEEHRSGKSTKEASEPFETEHDKPKEVGNHDGVKKDETKAHEENLNPAVEMKTVILESRVGGDGKNTGGSGERIGHQGQPIDASLPGENHDSPDKGTKLVSGKGEVTQETMMGGGVLSGAKEDAEPQRKGARTIDSNSRMRGSIGTNSWEKSRAELTVQDVSKQNGRAKQMSVKIQPMNEELPSEKKLWEQVDALQSIVGYKAARKPSLIEELKALYIFTGVELPPSFEKSIDIRGMEDKIHFLMSIVGVKV